MERIEMSLDLDVVDSCAKTVALKIARSTLKAVFVHCMHPIYFLRTNSNTTTCFDCYGSS